MNKNLYKTIINRNTGLIAVVAENKMAVFSFSGSLKNNFDAAKVQGEIDLGVEVMQDFSRNVQDLNRRKNIELDELKEELKAGKKTQEEYDQAVKKIETEKVIINMLAGGLMSPSDSALGIATSAVSPAVSFQVGQHFKKKGKEGSFEHIATHAVIGALTSAANGGNALSGAVSAGGAEYIAQVTTETLFKKDADELTADEKQTVSSIAQLVGVVSGSVTGDSSLDAYVGGIVATNAVENNQFARPVRRGNPFQNIRNDLNAANYQRYVGQLREILNDKNFNGLPSYRDIDSVTRKAIIPESEVQDMARFVDFVLANPNRNWTTEQYVRNFQSSSYNSVAPANLSPAGAGRSGAFNQAKRDGNIPVTRQPDFVMPNTDRLGIIQPGRAYYFETGRTVRRENGKDVTYVTYTVIRDDVAGHYWGANNPQNRNQHFNRDEYTYPMVNGRPNFDAKPEITTKYSVHYDY